MYRKRVAPAAAVAVMLIALALGSGPGAAQPAPVTDAPELAPADEGFSCRASSVRLATGTAEDDSKLEPFVANRDVRPCVDDDTGAPSLTQLPPPEEGEEPGSHAIVGAVFARTRDGDLEDDPEAPPPPEEEGVTFADAGAGTATLSDGEQSLTVSGARAQASVRCVDGTPVFDSDSSVLSVVVVQAGEEPRTIEIPPDDPDTAPDESHVHVGDENGPIHLNHTDGPTTEDNVTTLTRKAVWLENGDPPAGNGSDGEIVVGEASVDITGNPCTGRLTIVKNAVPNSPQDFTFTGLPASPFALDDEDPQSESGELPRSRTFDLAPGTYTPTEEVPAGYQLRDVSCVGDSQAAPAPNGATVTLQRTEDVTCTFLNIADAICPAGSVPNDQGQCIVTETDCPAGSTENAAGQCVVNTQVCPAGSTQQGGQCVANETTCPPGSTFNAQGECVVTETECPAGSVENATGQCVSTQVVVQDLPRGGVVVPIDDVPGASRSRCSRRGFGRNVAIVGTNGPDRITGTNRADRIFSFGGRDRVSGGRGNDCVEGGSGNDNLDGSNGGDALLGGTGRDILNGGTGRDRLEGASGNDKLTGGSGHDAMFGGSGIDKLSGGLGNDRLSGGAGRDYIDGGNGRDRVFGGAGNDAINVATEGRGRDVVNCGRGRDVVRATADDVIRRNCERVLIVRRRR